MAATKKSALHQIRTSSAAKEDANTITFLLDDREITASKPKQARYLLLASTSESDNQLDSIIEVMKFVDGSFAVDDRKHIASRLEDPEDDFDIDDVIAIFNYLTEAFSGRPTE